MNWIIIPYFTLWYNNQLLRKYGIFLACDTFQKQKGNINIFTKQNYLWTHQRYADFQTACILRSALDRYPKILLFEDGVHRRLVSFCLYILCITTVQLTFETNVNFSICNVMVVLLYLLCALDLILNVESTPEMFPPSVFGVWQIGIRALVYSE